MLHGGYGLDLPDGTVSNSYRIFSCLSESDKFVFNRQLYLYNNNEMVVELNL